MNPRCFLASGTNTLWKLSNISFSFLPSTSISTKRWIGLVPVFTCALPTPNPNAPITSAFRCPLLLMLLLDHLCRTFWNLVYTALRNDKLCSIKLSGETQQSKLSLGRTCQFQITDSRKKMTFLISSCWQDIQG